jgi:hypothetical protein
MQEVTKDELMNGYLRQQDYTRKTQEIAEEKKRLSSEQKQTDPANNDAGYQYAINVWGDYYNELIVDKKINRY